MKMSNEINELGTALALANEELANPKKTSSNPFFKSKYADLSECVNVSRPVLAKNGLSISQMPSYDLAIVTVETLLIHSSGQWIMSKISAPADKPTAQGIGSAITYCRRYSLAAMVGLAQQDDDGQEATKSTAKKPKQPPVVPKAQIIKARNDLDKYYATVVSATALEKDKDKARKNAKEIFDRAKVLDLIQVCDKYISLFEKN
jgi:hypothetical protein